MSKKYKIPASLDYLKNKPTRINWEIIAGPPLDPIQMYDLVFDETDLKIRKLTLDHIDMKIRKLI